MGHTTRDRDNLIKRVRRIRGQVEAIERTLHEDHDCADLLQQVAACRGALNGLMTELIAGHMRFHVMDSHHGDSASRARAAEEILDIVRSYLK